MDNTPSHLNLPERIHWTEYEGKCFRILNTFQYSGMLITNPAIVSNSSYLLGWADYFKEEEKKINK